MEFAYLYKTTMVYARRFGLSQQDAEDCACSFVLRCLEKQKAEVTPGVCAHLTAESEQAWWQRCAKNYALNYRRGLHRYQQHLASCCDESDDSFVQIPLKDQNKLPYAFCLRQEATDEIYSALALLPRRTRHLFVAYHLEGRSLNSLAQEQRMQPSAVSQTLFRARIRLRLQLEQSGWTRDEFVIAFRRHY